MRILNFGSLNIDHVYQVDHFVRPGETLSSRSYQMFAGGKGANQSIALGLAGAPVCHAGAIGRDGVWLRDLLEGKGVDVAFITVTDGPSGHAIIQVTPEGENAIILNPGANHGITPGNAESVLRTFDSEDWMLLQNETSSIPDLLHTAHARGMTVVFNPAPMNAAVANYPLACVDYFIVNEIEGEELSGKQEPRDIVTGLCDRYGARTVLTLGSRGVLYGDGDRVISVAAQKVRAVDTTAAGDCFIGYFLAALCSGSPVEAALDRGCRAAAIAVTRPGAADSLPTRGELDEAIQRDGPPTR